ncbi:MAG: tRNA-specific adenosine deaminase, partial [Aquificota bacterium]
MLKGHAVRLCLELSKEAFQKGEVPVACVVLKGEEIIGSAHNRVEELKDPTAHAE